MAPIKPFKNVTITLAEAEVGDLIEFRRTGYCHWAVYTGEGFAIHMYLPSKTHKYAKIVKELVVNIAGNDRCRVNNLEENASEKGLRARSPRDIVLTAESHLGDVVEYRLFSENCEYFATSCRYGKEDSFSGQVDTVAEGAALVVVGAVVGFGVVAGINLTRSSGNRQNKR